MVLIYSDTAIPVDLLFIQAKQTEGGRTDRFAYSAPHCEKKPLQVSLGDNCSQTFFFRSISLNLLHSPLRVTQKLCTSALK